MKQTLIFVAIIAIISALVLIVSFRAAHPFTYENCQWSVAKDN